MGVDGLQTQNGRASLLVVVVNAKLMAGCGDRGPALGLCREREKKGRMGE